jgi:deoxyribonuclease-4
VRDDVEEAARILKEHGLVAFAHAAYTVNLSTDNEEACAKNVAYLRQELALGTALGLKGVVVHVGKSVAPAGVERMKQAILTILGDRPTRRPACPLLIETPAGQGSELLAAGDEFVDFVGSNFGGCAELQVCIDTCHVFASAVPMSPSQYIAHAVARLGAAKVALVHFNDSKCPEGSRKDRHESPGAGHIGAVEMRRIAGVCQEYGIPMVVE